MRIDIYEFIISGIRTRGIPKGTVVFRDMFFWRLHKSGESIKSSAYYFNILSDLPRIKIINYFDTEIIYYRYLICG